MFSRIGTIAIVAVMALLLSGVAIAQIGVFETPEIDPPGSSATIDQAPNVMPASDSTSNDIPSTTAPDYDSKDVDVDFDSDDSDSASDDYDFDSDDYDSDDYESDDYDTDDGSDDSDNDAYDSDDYDSDDKDESYLSVPGTVMTGSVEYAAADAGTVWITFDGYYLTFDNYVLNDGWYVTKQDVKSD
ncbi:MAG: hypothetical protein KJP22_02900, partial [Acidimicrobiia bacterium]|nr:hypothetical protein [Acidimicrobiia bacterium]